MNGAGLTQQQSELLAFIRDYSASNDFSPSYQEMQDALGLASKSGVFRLLEALVERGRIKRFPNRARAIILMDQPALPADLEQRVSAYCRRIGITRPVFDQRAAESLLRGRA